MPETTTTSIPSQAGEVLAYKPVSGWAILGLTLGIVFNVVAVFFFFFDPLALPLWSLSAAVAGVAVSLVGIWHVAVSEGTRVGKGLALWGLWLNIVSALGYAAFYTFTYLALIGQANDFLMVKDADDDQGRKPNSGFFERLKEGAQDPTQYDSAFLLTLRPAKRKSSDPTNHEEMKKKHDVVGQLTRFREIQLVKWVCDATRQARETGGEVTVEPLGVVSWERLAEGPFKVKRNYRISTPEVTATVAVTVYSIDTAGEPRRWMAPVVAMPAQRDPVEVVQAVYTPLGDAVRKIQEQAFKSLRTWARKLPAGPLSIPNNAASEAILPKALQVRVNNVFKQEGGAALSFEPPSSVSAPWKKVIGDRLQFHYPVTLNVPTEQPKFTLVGFLIVESRTPVDPHNYHDAETDWDVVSLQWERVERPMSGMGLPN